MNIQQLVRSNIRDLVPYSAARYEFDGSDAILLDANENPYRGNHNRYPDPWQRDLKVRIGKERGLALEKIFIGNGADEAIDLLIRAFCEPGQDSILVNDPTYSMYRVSANINGNRTIKVPLNADFSLDPVSVLSAVEPTTKLIFLCSPANPTGNLLNKESIKDIIKTFQGIVIIDEAYIDFADDEGFIPMLNTYDNLIVVQTFSKAWALAGIRVGMAFGNPEIINILNKIKPPYNVSGPAQKLALEAFQDKEKFDWMVNNILTQKVILEDFLKKFSLCQKVFPSDSNFVLVRFKDSANIYKHLKKELVIVRDRSFETHCEDCLRITIGTKEEIEKLIELLVNYEKEITVH